MGIMDDIMEGMERDEEEVIDEFDEGFDLEEEEE